MTRIVWISGLTIAMAVLGCAGCAADRHSFSTRAVVAPSAGLDVQGEVDRAMEGIVERGRAIGLTITARDARRLVLTGAAAPRGATGEAPRKDEGRRVVAEAVFTTTPEGGITYRYDIDLVGHAPASTSNRYEQGVLRAMLLVREVFEAPLDVDAR